MSSHASLCPFLSRPFHLWGDDPQTLLHRVMPLLSCSRCFGQWCCGYCLSLLGLRDLPGSMRQSPYSRALMKQRSYSRVLMTTALHLQDRVEFMLMGRPFFGETKNVFPAPFVCSFELCLFEMTELASESSPQILKLPKYFKVTTWKCQFFAPPVGRSGTSNKQETPRQGLDQSKSGSNFKHKNHENLLE